MENKILCSFCGEPIECFACEGPTGAMICSECIEIIVAIVTDVAVQQQAEHATLN